VGKALFADVVNAGGRKIAALLESRPEEGVRQLLLAAATGAVVVALSTLASTLGAVAASRYLTPRLWGPGPTVREALGFSFSRLGVIAASLGLAFGWTLLIGAALGLPVGALAGASALASSAPAKIALGLLAALAAMAATLVLFLWFIVRFALIGQVIAMEPLGPLGVFRRSDALTSGSIGPGVAGWVKLRLTLLITVISVVLVIVSLVTGLPAFAVQVIYGNPFDPLNATPEAVPQLLLVPAQLLQVIAGAVFTPVYLAPFAVFYVDMRVRREGFDFALALEAA
jgi:hypothetical protein